MCASNSSVCPAGMYASPSNNSCSFCPTNSFSEVSGLAQCTCTSGYYRARTGEEDLPCRCRLPGKLHVARLGGRGEGDGAFVCLADVQVENVLFLTVRLEVL